MDIDRRGRSAGGLLPAVLALLLGGCGVSQGDAPAVDVPDQAASALTPAEAELVDALGGIPVDNGKISRDELRRRVMSPPGEEQP
ncbi:hypothetical protein [Luteimonas sp. A501]